MPERCLEAIQISDKLPENFGTQINDSQCKVIRISLEAWETFIQDSYKFRQAKSSPEYKRLRDLLTVHLKEAREQLTDEDRNELFEDNRNDIYGRPLFDQALDAVILKLFATYPEHPAIREYITDHRYWQELIIKAGRPSLN